MSEKVPSLAQWAGGADKLALLFRRFYEHVRDDLLLAPVFETMPTDHAMQVAHFVGEVLGGPKTYSAGGGSHAQMITKHMGRHLTHEQRRAWMALLLATADEIGLPDDPEFRASLTGYLEWGSRLAVMNAQDGVVPPDPDLAMPSWNWSSPGGPYRP
ncbi:MAG: group II truncated hemoglobin [Propionivibrio sp.]